MNCPFPSRRVLVKDAAESAKLQEFLFKQGYSWPGWRGKPSRLVQHVEEDVIIIEHKSPFLSTSKFQIDEQLRRRPCWPEVNAEEFINYWTQIEGNFTIENLPTSRNKYSREIKPGVWVDVYDVLRAFTVTDSCLQHLIKKALACGVRGHKDALEDYEDIVASASRGLEIYKEWNL